MKLPTPIGAALAAAITGGIAVTSEIPGISHPAHQAIIIAGGFLIAVVGYLTVPASSSASSPPPFVIPDPLPTPAPLAPATATTADRAAIDQAAAAAAQRSLP